MQRKGFGHTGTEAQNARRVEERVRDGVRERRSIVIRDKEGNKTPLRLGDWKLELQLAQTPRRIADIMRVKRKIDRLVTKQLSNIEAGLEG